MSFTQSPAFQEIERLANRYPGEPTYSRYDKWVIDLNSFEFYKTEHNVDDGDVLCDIRQDYLHDHCVGLYWPVELAYVSPLAALVKIVEKMQNDSGSIIATFKRLEESIKQDRLEEQGQLRNGLQEKRVVAAKPKRTRKAKATA